MEIANRKILNHGWVNFPLAYTQVATLSVFSYMFTSLFASQYLIPTNTTLLNNDQFPKLNTLGPRTTLPLGRQRCSVVQISVVQGNRYVVSVLLKIISVVQGQPYIVSVLYNSAVQVKK